jgi:hypothetical protein
MELTILPPFMRFAIDCVLRNVEAHRRVTSKRNAAFADQDSGKSIHLKPYPSRVDGLLSDHIRDRQFLARIRPDIELL